MIHGAGPTAAVARRWKTQINENAKAPAFWSELPEANHNEICGWERGRHGAVRGVFLEDPDQHPRVERRIELTAEEVERAGAPALRVQARGREPRSSGCCRWCMLGDLVSVYLAVLDGVDPDAGRGDRAPQGAPPRAQP